MTSNHCTTAQTDRQLTQAKARIAELEEEKADWLEAVVTSDARHRAEQERSQQYREALERIRVTARHDTLGAGRKVAHILDTAIIALSGVILPTDRARAALAEEEGQCDE